MGILADIYVSRDDEAVQYGATPDAFPDCLQYKSISSLELSTLWALMSGIKWEVNLMKEFACLLVKDEGERVIHKVPPAMLRDLAALTPQQVEALAAKWAATDEFACEPAEVQPIIENLVQLAQKVLRLIGIFIFGIAYDAQSPSVIAITSRESHASPLPLLITG
jgi:hypothetical protein